MCWQDRSLYSPVMTVKIYHTIQMYTRWLALQKFVTKTSPLVNYPILINPCFKPFLPFRPNFPLGQKFFRRFCCRCAKFSFWPEGKWFQWKKRSRARSTLACISSALGKTICFWLVSSWCITKMSSNGNMVKTKWFMTSVNIWCQKPICDSSCVSHYVPIMIHDYDCDNYDYENDDS